VTPVTVSAALTKNLVERSGTIAGGRKSGVCSVGAPDSRLASYRPSEALISVMMHVSLSSI